MARRKLVNIDDKILRATIKIGAESGINNIPARKVAKQCGISDATIFEHFQNKQNLILQAKLYVDKELLKIQSSVKFNQEEFTKTFKEAWEACFDYLVNHPLETKFYDRYRHSEYYRPTTSAETNGIVRKLYEYMTFFKPSLTEREHAFEIIVAHAVETTIHVALQVIEGKMTKTEETTEFVFNLIFGGILCNT
jgi:AcrR family transcriptional regulator